MGFQTWYSYFKYLIILFRLFNILASFQGYINKIFAKMLINFVIVYLLFDWQKKIGCEIFIKV